jgi:signal transduction histidine kinase
LLAVSAWWIVLSQESRELAERDLVMALEKLRETQRELAQRERLAAIGEIAATVSHELRNPLGTLVSSIDVLRRSIPSPGDAARGELDRIQRNVWRCVRIIDDLLDYSRKRPLSLTTVDLDVWVRQQLAEQRPVDCVRIDQDLAAGIAVLVDDERLRQALVNLVQNAIHAVEAQRRADGGEITVRTRTETDAVVLSVSDNGCGMTSDVSARAFEPLFSTRPFGTGLGMSLVKRIVEQHGGEIAIESAPGRGTTVTLRLPRRAEARIVADD